MWWWISGGVVLVAVVALVMIGAALRREVAELQRVAELANERNQKAQRRLESRATQVQRSVAEIQAQSRAWQRPR